MILKNSHLSPTRKRSGFTLIELLVVMTIMSILFGVGFVAYRDFSRRQVVASGARKLDGLLRKTQSLAVSGEKPSDCAAEILDGYVFEMISDTAYKIYVECPPDTNKEIESGSLTSGVVVTSTPANEKVYFNALAKGVDFESGGSSLDYTVSYAQAGVASQVVTVTKGGQIQ